MSFAALLLALAASTPPQNSSVAVALWQGYVLVADTHNQVYLLQKESWSLAPVGQAKTLAANSKSLFLLSPKGFVQELQGLWEPRGQFPAPEGTLALGASEKALFFGVPLGPEKVKVEAWDLARRPLWQQECEVPLNQAEARLEKEYRAAGLFLPLLAREAFRMLVRGEEPWILYPLRNLWVRVNAQGCQLVRWDSPRYLSDPEESKWKKEGDPFPWPPYHLQDAWPAPAGGWLVIPGLAHPQLGFGVSAESLCWYNDQGKLLGKVLSRELGARDLQGVSVVGGEVVLWDRNGKVYRRPWAQLFPREGK
jgi:hypothetical protein